MTWIIVIICYGIVAAIVGGIDSAQNGDDAEAIMLGIFWPLFLVIYPFEKLYHFSAKWYRKRKKKGNV